MFDFYRKDWDNLLIGIGIAVLFLFLLWLFTSCTYVGTKVDRVSPVIHRSVSPYVVMGQYWGNTGEIGYYLIIPNRSYGGGVYRWLDTGEVYWEP